MKKTYQDILVAVVAFMATVAVLNIPSAQAGDDPAFALAYGADGGAGVECTGALRPKTRYAVQPTSNVYVRVTTSPSQDGGVLSATTSSVRVDSGKLYDTPTTSLQLYICVKPVSNGSGTLNGFIYRGPTE